MIFDGSCFQGEREELLEASDVTVHGVRSDLLGTQLHIAVEILALERIKRDLTTAAVEMLERELVAIPRGHPDLAVLIHEHFGECLHSVPICLAPGELLPELLPTAFSYGGFNPRQRLLGERHVGKVASEPTPVGPCSIADYFLANGRYSC